MGSATGDARAAPRDLLLRPLPRDVLALIVVLLGLRIENLALIERAALEPAPGLNVLTGETGAGKTILAQAVGLLAGGAAAPVMVGPHGEEAYVEAEFAVPSRSSRTRRCRRRPATCGPTASRP